MNRKNTTLYFFVLALGLFLFHGCSSDDDPTVPGGSDTVQQSIGPAGGSIQINGTASLEVPAGSLGTDVEFTMKPNSQPQAAPAGRTLIGSAVTVGPSGTTFTIPANITLNYPVDLSEAEKASLVVYTDNGTGWVPLGSTVDSDNNQITASTTHLSDFAVMSGGQAASGTFSVLTVQRAILNLDTPTVVDIIMARFDGQVDSVQVLNPLHPDSVSCNESPLEWNSELQVYARMPGGTPFLSLGQNYVFEIQASDEVPATTETISFPATAPMITNINNLQGLPLDGFTVEWSGDEAGTNVFLSLAPESGGDPFINIETENDGSYTFSEGDLSGITAGLHGLVLTRKEQATITATGYDPQSFLLAQIVNTTMVDMGGAAHGGNIGPEGGVIIIGDSDGFLDVPAGALSSTIQINAEQNMAPLPAPVGWRFLSPVFTLSIEPAGTTFSVPAEISFGYADADLLGGDENQITIYMDGGMGWTALSTTVDDGANSALAMTDNVADFVLMINNTVTEDVYANITLQRSINDFDGSVIRGDEFYARFDEFVSPDGPVSPLQPESVLLNEFNCAWIEENGRYRYSNVENITPTFYELTGAYDIHVTAENGVPDLEFQESFVDREPYVTNLQFYQEVSSDGFEVQWNGTNDGEVTLTIYGLNNSLVVVQTDNDGNYTFSEAELSVIPTELPSIILELVYQERHNLVAAGFDPESLVIIRTYNQTSLQIVEPDGK